MLIEDVTAIESNVMEAKEAVSHGLQGFGKHTIFSANCICRYVPVCCVYEFYKEFLSVGEGRRRTDSITKRRCVETLCQSREIDHNKVNTRG